MAKRGSKKSEKTSAAESTSSSEAGRNLSDDDLLALFLQHKKLYERGLAVKKKADADFRNACKLIKAEGGKHQVEKIKTALRLETEEGEAEVRAELLETLQVARWIGASIGTQFEMFGVDDGSHDFRAEGKRTGLAGDPCKPPAELSGQSADDWIAGWHEGQAAKAQGFRRPNPFSENVAAGEAHIRNLGTKEPTHTIAE